MKYGHCTITVAAAAVILILLSGCAGQSAPSKFYILSPLNPAGSVPLSKAKNTASLLIGPVNLPDHLDRPQIVISGSPSELSFAEHARWAGSLRENIASVLAENLSSLLATEQVYVYPLSPPSAADLSLRVNVIRLDSVPADRVVLKASWMISRGAERQETVTRISDISEKVSDTGYGAIVSAMSRATGRLSMEIADEIIRLQN